MNRLLLRRKLINMLISWWDWGREGLRLCVAVYLIE